MSKEDITDTRFAVVYQTGTHNGHPILDTVSTFTTLDEAATFYDTNNGVRLDKIETTTIKERVAPVANPAAKDAT